MIWFLRSLGMHGYKKVSVVKKKKNCKMQHTPSSKTGLTLYLHYILLTLPVILLGLEY